MLVLWIYDGLIMYITIIPQHQIYYIVLFIVGLLYCIIYCIVLFIILYYLLYYNMVGLLLYYGMYNMDNITEMN